MNFIILFVFSNALLFWGRVFLLVCSRFQGAVNLIFLRPLFFLLGLLVLVDLVLVWNAFVVLFTCLWNLIGGRIKMLLIYYFSVIFLFIVLLDQENFYEMVFFWPFYRSSPILFFLRWVVLSSIFLVATSCGLLAGAIFLWITVLLNLIPCFRYVDFGR